MKSSRYAGGGLARPASDIIGHPRRLRVRRIRRRAWLASFIVAALILFLCLLYGPPWIRATLGEPLFRDIGTALLIGVTTLAVAAAVLLVQICSWLLEWRVEVRHLEQSLDSLDDHL
ncbi:MAG: hypothetical protein KDK91_14675 [Gammaproteobacteria bacterium]|nr:hypothetical protein [Gammaproteobacteria bacterium]